METKKLGRAVSPLFTIALWVTLSFVALCILDDDKSCSGFVDLGTILAFPIYGIPAIYVCFLLYKYFTRKHFTFGSIAVALIIGIPVSFATIVAILVSLNHFSFV